MLPQAALLVLASFTLLPLLWMVVASLRPPGQAARLLFALDPDSFTLRNYAEIFTRLRLARAFFNSAFLAVVTTAIALVVNSMAGYAFAKLRFRGRDGLFRVLSAALVDPGPGVDAAPLSARQGARSDQHLCRCRCCPAWPVSSASS